MGSSVPPDFYVALPSSKNHFSQAVFKRLFSRVVLASQKNEEEDTEISHLPPVLRHAVSPITNSPLQNGTSTTIDEPTCVDTLESPQIHSLH